MASLRRVAAVAIVFVVDSLTFRQEFREVAEFLYELLTSKKAARGAVPLLVACNKQDIVTASDIATIKKLLLSEL